MKKLISHLSRFVAVSALFGSMIFAGPTPSSAEGSGVGSGGAPPPKIMCATGDFVLYDDGLVIYSDGTYTFAW